MKKLIMSVVAIATLSTYASANTVNDAEVQKLLKTEKSSICVSIKDTSTINNKTRAVETDGLIYSNIKKGGWYEGSFYLASFNEKFKKAHITEEIKKQYKNLNNNFLQKLNLASSDAEHHLNLFIDYLALKDTSLTDAFENEKINELYLFLNSVYNESQQNKFKGFNKDEVEKLNAILYLKNTKAIDYEYFLTFINENKNNKKLQELFKVAMLKKYPKSSIDEIANLYNQKPRAKVNRPMGYDKQGQGKVEGGYVEPETKYKRRLVPTSAEVVTENLQVGGVMGGGIRNPIEVKRQYREEAREYNSRKKSKTPDIKVINPYSDETDVYSNDFIENNIFLESDDDYVNIIPKDSILYKAKERKILRDQFNIDENSLNFIINENEKSGIEKTIEKIQTACDDSSTKTIADVIHHNKTKEEAIKEKESIIKKQNDRVLNNYNRVKDSNKEKICGNIFEYPYKVEEEPFTKQDLEHLYFKSSLPISSQNIRDLYDEVRGKIERWMKEEFKSPLEIRDMFEEACDSEENKTIKDVREHKYEYKKLRSEDKERVCGYFNMSFRKQFDIQNIVDYEKEVEKVIFLAKLKGKEKGLKDLEDACKAWFGVNTYDDLANY